MNKDLCDDACEAIFVVPEDHDIVVPCDIEEDLFTIPEDDVFVRPADDNVFRRPGN